MNPLQRRLFRLQQPGMSRQPMGILASSPQLVTAAQKAMMQGQPMKAQTGASVNTGGSVGDYMQAIQQLKQAGDKATLNNIAADQRLPRSVQIAAGNALFGISGPSQAAPVSDTERMAANRSSLGALRGRVTQNALTDQAMSTIAAGGSPRDGIETIDPRITDNIDALTALRGRTRADALSDEAMAQMRPDPLTSPDILPSMPDEASGMDIMGEEPKMLPFGMDRLVTGLGEEISKDITEATTGRRPDKVQQEGQRGGEKIGERAAFLQTPESEAPAAEAPAAETETKEDKTPDPVTAAENLMGTEADAQFMQISETLGDKDKTNKQKADATDAALGIKGTRKERTEQRYEMLKDLLGEDKADDIRTDVGYNLMMTGLMIAAGQSPDAMTNIAGGLAKGLAGYGKAAGEAAQAESKEEKALKLMAAKEVGAEITAETAAEIKARELAEERSFREKMQQEKLTASKEIAQLPGDTQRMLQEIADQSGMSMADVYLLQKAGKDTDTQRLAADYLKQYGPRGLTAEEAGILATVKLSDYGSPEEAIKELFKKDLSVSAQGQNNKVVVDPSQLKQK